MKRLFLFAAVLAFSPAAIADDHSERTVSWSASVTHIDQKPKIVRVRKLRVGDVTIGSFSCTLKALQTGSKANISMTCWVDDESYFQAMAICDGDAPGDEDSSEFTITSDRDYYVSVHCNTSEGGGS